MSFLQVILLLLLAQPDFCLMRQNVSDERCSNRQWEVFLKQEDLSSYCGDAEHRYHFVVKEKLSSVLSNVNHLTDKDQVVEYQSK